MEGLTALIITRDERQNIGRTLAAITWVPRVLLVDSFSSDDTCEIARRFSNLQIVQREFDTHAAQWNFGLDNVATEWVLALDADYELSPQLSAEIQALEVTSDVAGYDARFEYRIVGRLLRASVYPPRTVLFRPSVMRYYDDGHTQALPKRDDIHHLSGLIYHDDRKPLSRWIESQDRYAKLEAAHLLATPHQQLTKPDRLRKRTYFAAPIMFLYLLFARGLILDGWAGWYYVMQRTVAELLLSLRLLTERHQLEAWEPR